MAFMNNVGQNNNVLSQSYKVVLAATQLSGFFERDIVQLSAFTDNTPRVPGTIVAKLTSGPNVGTFINYKDSGANGQGQAVAIIIDQYLNPADNISVTYAEVLRIGRVLASALVITTGSTLLTALTQLQATEFYDGARQLCYDIRGPQVSST